MLGRGEGNSQDCKAKLQALDRAMAIIEFDCEGKVLAANRNFLETMGYALAEIQGKHHSLFVDAAERNRPEYSEFWRKLRNGEFQRARYKRIGKGGKEIWIEGSYNPLLDSRGKVYKIVKYATDITPQQMEFADLRGQASAIRKSLAVIEFAVDGTILTANENFLNTMGYSLREIEGRHHSMFVEPSYKTSPEYSALWAAVGRGQHQAGQFKRLTKNGKAVWIEASYNPILDANGRVAKVVKFATDITRQVEVLENLQRIIDTNFGEIDKAFTVLKHTTEATSQATAETSSNVNAVAAASEELTASISEISQRMAQSKTASEDAVRNAAAADEATRQLTQSTEAMGGIVQVIQEIASQINLLSLNATIEAARAGPAGRGFAVVASEVKSLASQAAAATARVTNEIEGVQSVSSNVASGLARIKHSIESMREYIAASAAAVEEQSAVTQDVSSNMSGASSAVASIDGNMCSVAAAIEQAANAVSHTREAARVLAR